MPSSSRSREWSAPPEGILLHIFSFLEPEYRLLSALVNCYWAEAAAISTKRILCAPRHKRSVQALQFYLRKHGEHVNSLCFRTSWSKNRALGQKFLSKQLPCPNLLEFEFIGLTAQLLPSGKTSHLLQAATGLTRLSFHLTGEVPRSVSNFAVLTDLRHLRSLQVAIHRPAGEADTGECAMDGAFFAQLPHLTQLQLTGPIHIDTLRHISCLAALQELQIQLDRPVAEAADISHLLDPSQPQPQPQLQQLTALQLGAPQLAINSRAIRWLAGLPLLRAEFSRGCLESQVICAYTQLTKLKTDGTKLAGGAFGLQAFLSSLRSLPHLEACSLELHDSSPAVPSPQACRSLTAGSKLSELHLSCFQLPPDSWQHTFPAGVQLGLTCLSLTHVWGESVSTEHLQRLVQCCPHLRRLSLDHAVEWALDLQPLAQLSGLGSLFLGGFLHVDAAERAAGWSQAVNTLAQLPALTNLSFGPPDVLSRTEMLQLTAVTGLVMLHMNAHEDSEQLLLDEGLLDGDVWYQLLLASLDDSACRDILLQQEAAVQQQLQEGGQDPKPVQLALQEAQARARLSRVQRRFERQLKASTRKYLWGQRRRH